MSRKTPIPIRRFDIRPALAVASVLGLAGTSAFGENQNMSASNVVTACGTPDEAWISFCNGYAQAVFDTAILSGASICPPAGTTRATMADTVFRSLYTLQEQAGVEQMAEWPGAGTVTVALERHYPC
ncbi:Rap1a/Tai family immunity protein [Paracoccus sp. 22332]|uniref:Rap1a/Tai family immunity protein n=1 Tax=Paracoccus sp. 22332 TaxID=3453913 RepID=UPI003F85982D